MWLKQPQHFFFHFGNFKKLQFEIQKLEDIFRISDDAQKNWRVGEEIFPICPTGILNTQCIAKFWTQ